jgi:hypothetical protein
VKARPSIRPDVMNLPLLYDIKKERKLQRPGDKHLLEYILRLNRLPE